MTPEEELPDFDVNGPGMAGKLFGLPFTGETAKMVILPVPWDATVSYRTGTADAPAAILQASRQVDLFVRAIPDAWRMGISMLPVPVNVRADSERLRLLVEQHHLNNTVARDEYSEFIPTKIDEACESLSIYVKKKTGLLLDAGKMVGLLGGDHSTPLGFLGALSERHDGFGILHVDAHADLRKGYEGFLYSHGAIMYHALKIPQVTRLVQVGVRDLCEEEFNVIRGNAKVRTYFDDDLKFSRNSKSWEAICSEIVGNLPEKIYISFDIDGLDPKLCPHTGTPVPGGLEFDQACSLIRTVAASGKTIIGFDLNEVAPGDWDANVGARVLWQLCLWMGVSQGQLKHLPLSGGSSA